ncbi:MAG: hypothetical protein L3J25_05800 [Flavobacteriaceae bacterium]|nr:hypothetical protein [Flavobacteriaceae bacterium]
MSDKKHIDRLFQEKLKDFEVTPSDSVWENISTELQSRKKDKKGIPVWWRLAGVAAALLLLFTISQLMLNNDPTTPSEETIVDIDSKKDTINNNLQDVVNKGNTIAEEKNISGDLKSKSSNNSVFNKITTPSQNDDSANKSKNVTVVIENQNDNTSNINKQELVASSGETKNTIVEQASSNLPQDKIQDQNFNEEVANEVLKDISKATETTLANTKVKEGVSENEKMSLTEEIALIEDENIEDTTNEKFERWSAASNIAPVYFNSLGNGSSIHPQFNNNSKTGNINMSYGISGSYAINKKLSVRAGVNKVTLGYSTNDVVAFINVDSPNNPQLLRNIQYNETGSNLSFISTEVFNFAQVPDILKNVIKSSIDQKLGFIEIPLELEYKISSKKIGVNIIGGFSALLLSDNEIYSVVDGNSTLLGKATNINNTSFSANFGLGFDFKITNKFNLNLEPVFKYQLNTFNNTSGNFKPYFIGVYSGLSFKF